jgi:mono/diheme cytochrome c family protein
LLWIWLVAGAPFLIHFGVTAAQAQGRDPRRGLTLAMEACARCHRVSPEQRHPGEPGIPSFMRMAADPQHTRESLLYFMGIPHFEMPPPVLTREEREHVVAYILSLRK